jgi:thioredoxin-related protein/Flp pilus assembly protein TadD
MGILAMKKLAAITATLVFMTFPLQAEIHFLKGRLGDATMKAEKEKKSVMVDFITDWCRWCDTLDARTYSDASVASYVNTHLVAIKIDAEKGEGIEIAKKYGVNAYPTIVFIKPDGEEIDRILGYVPAEPFLKTVTDYVTGVNTFGALQSAASTRPDDPAIRYTLASKYLDRNNLKLAAAEYQKVLDLDPSNTLGHNEEASFSIAIAALRLEKNPAKLGTFVADYPNSERLRTALVSLWNFHLKAKDGERAKKVFLQAMNSWPADPTLMNNYAWSCTEQAINLTHALEVSRKAVSLARNDGERAMYLDTQAAVEFGLGHMDEAIALEQQALDLIKDEPPAKRKDYEAAMAKFKAAKQGMSSK